MFSSPSMPPFRPAYRRFLSLAFATVALFAGCDDCPKASCSPPVVIGLNLPAGTDAGATVVACHVDACATATLPPAAAPGAAAPLSFPGGDVSGLLATRADGSLRLVVNWIMVGRTGDHYTLVVRDAAGAELASLDETATFPVASLSSGACLLCPSVMLGDPP